MKVFAVLLSVASVAVANIPYTEPGVRPGQGGVADVRPTVPVVQQPILPGGIATGAAGGDLSQGQFTGIHGTSQAQQLSASAEGTAANGGSSFNQGSSHGSQSTGPLGSHQTGGTSGTSIQHGGRPGSVFSARPIVPVVQQPVLLGGVATGAAGGDLSQGQFTGVHGTSQVQQISAGAEGAAANGGSSFNQGSSHGSQSTGLLGSHQTGGTSGSSVQLGGRPAVVPVHQPIGGLKRYDS